MDGPRVSRGKIGLLAFARKHCFGGFTERHGGWWIKIWRKIWVKGPGRGRRENARKDI
jgi:hypothetical protein